MAVQPVSKGTHTTLMEEEAIATLLRQEDAEATNTTSTRAKKRAAAAHMPKRVPLNQTQKTPVKPVTPPPASVMAFGLGDADDAAKRAEKALGELFIKIQEFAKERQIVVDSSPDFSAKPLLPGVPDPTPEEKKKIFSMIAYMMTILIASFEFAQSQSHTTTSNTDVSNSFTQESKKALDKAVQAYNELKQEEWENAHRPWYEQLWDAIKSIGEVMSMCAGPMLARMVISTNFSFKDQYKDASTDAMQYAAQSGAVLQEVLSVMMIVGGVATGNVGLVAMGSVSLSMAASGGQSTINDLTKDLGNAIGGGIVGQLLADIIVAVIEAGAVCGAASGLTSLVDGLAPEIEEDTADDAAANAAANGAAAAPAGAGQAGQAAVGAAAVKNATQKAGEDALKVFLKKLIATSIMMAGSTSTWGDMVKAFIEMGNKFGGPQTGQNTENLAASIGGALVGVAASLGAMTINTGETQAIGVVQRLTKLFGEKNYAAMMATIKGLSAIASLGAGAASVAQGVYQLEQADTLKKIGEAESTLSMYNSLTQLLNATISADNATANSVETGYSNDQWETIFIAPYNQV